MWAGEWKGGAAAVLPPAGQLCCHCPPNLPTTCQAHGRRPQVGRHRGIGDDGEAGHADQAGARGDQRGRASLPCGKQGVPPRRWHAPRPRAQARQQVSRPRAQQGQARGVVRDVSQVALSAGQPGDLGQAVCHSHPACGRRQHQGAPGLDAHGDQINAAPLGEVWLEGGGWSRAWQGLVWARQRRRSPSRAPHHQPLNPSRAPGA